MFVSNEFEAYVTTLEFNGVNTELKVQERINNKIHEFYSVSGFKKGDYCLLNRTLRHYTTFKESDEWHIWCNSYLVATATTEQKAREYIEIKQNSSNGLDVAILRTNVVMDYECLSSTDEFMEMMKDLKRHISELIETDKNIFRNVTYTMRWGFKNIDSWPTDNELEED